MTTATEAKSIAEMLEAMSSEKVGTTDAVKDNLGAGTKQHETPKDETAQQHEIAKDETAQQVVTANTQEAKQHVTPKDETAQQVVPQSLSADKQVVTPKDEVAQQEDTPEPSNTPTQEANSQEDTEQNFNPPQMTDNTPIATHLESINSRSVKTACGRVRTKIIMLQQQRQKVQEQIQQLKAQNEEIEASLHQSYQTLEYQQSLQEKAKALKPQTYQQINALLTRHFTGNTKLLANALAKWMEQTYFYACEDLNKGVLDEGFYTLIFFLQSFLPFALEERVFGSDTNKVEAFVQMVQEARSFWEDKS
ncbi:hypothetical protein [Helicobacter ailurogastricus]|uniref:hypothetical protein n=1 Tax=Helicobacter ailurogastricus TaxID=1578720 RepID=UPI0022C66F62|nr:hypothetical protein [Helicobacter ailurogastricus]GLH58536.1 hypothetical protein NHP214376_13270 [Helicobacter ailurogastricus]GLH60036.1 hypothetical protein NHP214377_13080 [Helicobacter ailurogastricus]